MSRYVVVLVLLTVAVVIVSSASTGKGGASKPTKKCPKNEVWSWCGKNCEATCNIFQPGWTICPVFKCSKKLSDCRCKPGLVRNEKNKCVEFETCKNKFG
ncbi:venom peptide SjAPI-2-like [Andrena cerasifolii]|uniref:venom peptide SjAPI-2-like n=1 Tax=Andrena cerasifolii TaxID=2819439 RepID=UPI0021337237